MLAELAREQARLHAEQTRMLADLAVLQGVEALGASCAASQHATPRRVEQDTRFYDLGYAALRNGRWELAVECFGRVIETNGRRADGALYWKAYAQNKLNQGAEALATLAELRRAYPKSRYLADAQVLEVEIRKRAGQPPTPDSQEDDELKLLALTALQHVEPERSVALLERFLQRAESPKLKERALFVLAQSRSDRARPILAAIARGEHNPDLQLQALRLVAYANTPDTRSLLAQVYDSTSDAEVRRLVVRAWGTLGERDRLLGVARADAPAEVRAEAVRQLAALKMTDALWDLYGRERDAAIKREILQALPPDSDIERLAAVARNEQDADLRRAAIRTLGLAPAEKSGATLVALYEAPSADAEVKRAVIHALAIQRNDTALVALARKEKDRTLRKEMVERLSAMKTKAAVDYLLEILGK